MGTYTGIAEGAREKYQGHVSLVDSGTTPARKSPFLVDFLARIPCVPGTWWHRPHPGEFLLLFSSTLPCPSIIPPCTATLKFYTVGTSIPSPLGISLSQLKRSRTHFVVLHAFSIALPVSRTRSCFRHEMSTFHFNLHLGLRARS